MTSAARICLPGVLARIVACLLIAAAPSVPAATVTAQVVADRGDVETRFDVDMGGNLVSLLPGDVATDANASDQRYVLVMARRSGFALTAAACSNRSDGSLPASQVDLGTGSILVDPGPDGVVDCVFTVQAELATVVATLVGDRPDIETRFTLDLGGKVTTLLPGESATDAEAAASGYAMTLMPQPGFDLAGVSCTDRAGGRALQATVTPDVGGALIDPGPGATVECVFSVQARLATVVATLAADLPEVEQEFSLDMGGNVVALWPGDIVTDPDARSDFYSMTLAPVSGYRLLDIACTRRSDGARLPANLSLDSGGITLAPGNGETVDCLFTIEVRRATVVATVSVDSPEPVEQSFDLDIGGVLKTMWPGDIVTDDDATPDLYAMALTPHDGFQLMDIACVRRADGSRMSANVDLRAGTISFAPGNGATVDCEFALRAAVATVVTTLTVDAPEPVEQSFNLDIDGVLKTIWPGDIATDDDASADLYRMALTPQSGYQLMGIACVRRADGNRMPASVDLGAGTISFAPGIGATIDCEFALRAAVATVIATVTTDSPQPVETTFTLEMNGEPVQMLANQYATDASARADLYRIALIPERGFRLADVACVRESDSQRLSAEITFENQSVAFAPGIGNRVRCTFQLNALRAAVTARVATNRRVDGTTFRLEMNGSPVSLRQGQVATDDGSRPDLYRIALIPVREYRLMDVACLRNGERLPANVDFTNQSIAFAPGAGTSVDCTFTLQAQRAQVTATASFGAGLPKRQLTFDMNGDEVTVMSGETATDGDANALLYRVALIRQPGMQVTDIACIKDGQRLSAITDLNNQSTGFTPGAGGSVDCTFSVEGGPVSVDVFDLMRESGVTPDASNSSLSVGPDGRPVITLGVPGAGSNPDSAMDTPAGTAPDAVAADACCSCSVVAAGMMPASSNTGPSDVPCDFDIPEHWTARAGNDGALVKIVAGPACGGTCTTTAPAIGFSIGTKPDSNAEVRESIWEQSMKSVGSGRCGEGNVTFYQPPGVMPGDPIGGVQFYVTLGGRKYGGSATFSCAGPGGWAELQQLFINSFRTNPSANFP